MSAPRLLWLVVLTFGFPGHADPVLPGGNARPDPHLAARSREVVDSLISMRIQRKANPSALQQLARELGTTRALLFKIVASSTGAEPSDELASSVARLKDLMLDVSQKAPTDPQIQGIEPALRSRIATLTDRLDTIVAERDPDRRRALAVELRQELERPTDRKRRDPNFSPRLERMQLGAGTTLRSGPGE